MAAYYNEIDSYCAQWLRNLIAAGHIADGDVDERSIEDVRPDDLRGYTQCHFFAGLGGWSYALRLAGYPDDRSVWTCSCPCQPYSAAGKGLGFADERHLWPAQFHLIKERKPSKVFGEQAASADGLAWLDLVQADMEGIRYACGAVLFPASCVGAPQIRERLYWVADAPGERYGLAQIQPAPRRNNRIEAAGSSICPSFWDSGRWQAGADGFKRFLQPGLEPLVDGHSGSVEQMRAYGNAINVQAAAEFIRAAA